MKLRILMMLGYIKKADQPFRSNDLSFYFNACTIRADPAKGGGDSMLSIVRGAAACLVAGASLAAMAQSFPARPVYLISQFPPGGQTDVVARLLAPKLIESTGQPFVVENKVGAAGLIGADYVAKSAADGYTVLVGNNSLVSNAAGIPKKMPFDLLKDFAPVTMVASVALALAVHPSVEASSVKELVELVRRQPGKWAYSSCGNVTPMHLTAELFKQQAKLDLLHVPYKGCGPAIAAGVGGHVKILFNNVAGLVAQAQGGKLRVLAVASARRSPGAPDIPTIAESGYEGFESSIWIGFLVPAKTPRAVVQKLNAELNKAASHPDVREKLRAQLMDYHSTTPEEFAALIRSDVAKWSEVVRAANITAN
jgi:tripartite-type tricarboxylate transporter receptor subunit TctC